MRRFTAAVLVLSALVGCATTQQKPVEAAEPEITETPITPGEGTAQAAAPTGNLQPLTAEGFSVQMPGTPQVTRNQVAIPSGQVTTAAWTSNPNGVIYSISTADFPQAAVEKRNPTQFLEEARDGLVTQLNGKLQSDQEATVDQFPGRAYTVTSDKGTVMARNYMVANRLYTMMVLYNPSTGMPPDAEGFLGSLKLMNPPAAPAPEAAPAPSTTP